ncbi:class I SAM-dependent methyltransferase [Lewinella cohaerens]|uniref:class I SAM-dependent methyltransferase n=1 Tax=Lewinella cohaerens TaxID=70995 RepID=UPI00035EAA67|nr:class I SAM-dependent methyltransferase [Lewinella cohaerens]
MKHTSAFDAIAGSYDDTFTNTAVGRLQRASVYDLVAPYLRNEQCRHILEVNCGSGQDAFWLTQQGKTVFATDISAEMIAVAAVKRRKLPTDQQKRLRLQTLSATDISSIKEEGPFDLIFSNFGGLNCLSPQELTPFLEDAAQLLRPGGHLVMVVMGRFCWWETLYFTLKGAWQKAWRRRKRTATDAPLDENTSIPTWYYSPSDFTTKAPKGLTQKQLNPIGFWVPPSYLDPFFASRPKLLRVLHQLEEKTKLFSGLAGGADHYFLVMGR